MTKILKKFCVLFLLSFFVSYVSAQDTTSSSPLQISGSADAYYKYDFAGLKGGAGNIPTSFASENNSVSLGMIDIMLKKATGKASFVGEVSFGPRGQYQSLLNSNGTYDESPGEASNSFHIQNLYMTYAFTEKFSMTAGYMGTFVGYEVISPVGNFNYSTSYLFTNGPFQNAGIKANYAISDKVGVMIGLFNDWNLYQDFNGVSDFGAQLSLSPVEGWSAYLNVITGPTSGTEFDLTTAYQLTKSFKLGLNAADYSKPNEDDGGFSGVALYPQYAFSDSFALGVRGEYFKRKDVVVGGVTEAGTKVTAFTLSGNIKAGGLTVIPELRLDRDSAEAFLKNNNGDMTKSASQFSLALVYAF